ncbi:DUF3046 domain-containing protein [Acaricomes phytoseiuli]|uniref:DUF3046 domain-containing protein n=1 Tax=Acaricomes phytoseiuli TaxID=291968 RepID=UPI000375A280|nr:DUF3046 domain-containing protein [Acaricomes phytoseiuli]MCW1248811.1 DUF3046 domain-containing protein [Acaricomes phytoseiuli]
MRHSEFWRLMNEEFGVSYARSVGSDIVLSALDGHTAVQALEAGYSPRIVWNAVCDVQGIPAGRRLGRDVKPGPSRGSAG